MFLRLKHSPFLYSFIVGLLAGILTFGHLGLKAQTQGGPLPPGATPTTQSATRADAAIQCQTTVSASGVLTFAAIPGETFYLTEVDISNSEDATGPAVGAPQTITTANLNGVTYETPNGPATTPGINVQTFSISYPTGLKSTVSSTASTLTNAATVTHEVVRLNACGFYA